MPKVYRRLLGKHYDPVDCGSKGVLDLFILPLISRKLITEFRAFRDDYFNNKDRLHHWSDEPLLCALYLGFAMGVGIELVRGVVAVILTIAFAGADLLMGVVTPLVMAAYLPVSLGIKLYEEYTKFCNIDPIVEPVEENHGLTP